MESNQCLNGLTENIATPMSIWHDTLVASIDFEYLDLLILLQEITSGKEHGGHGKSSEWKCGFIVNPGQAFQVHS